MYSKIIQKLIERFSRFPGTGPKTATRFVFYLIEETEENVKELVKLILELKKNIKKCQFCFNPFEGSNLLCPICSNPSRDKSVLAIVEKESDLLAIEKTGAFRGLYFILGGTVSTLRKEEIKKLRIKELKERLKNPERFNLVRTNFKEIIIAVNPTTDGQATALYLERILKPFNRKISQLARGLPTGGELEYADKETLSSAFEGRK